MSLLLIQASIISSCTISVFKRDSRLATPLRETTAHSVSFLRSKMHGCPHLHYLSNRHAPYPSPHFSLYFFHTHFSIPTPHAFPCSYPSSIIRSLPTQLHLFLHTYQTHFSLYTTPPTYSLSSTLHVHSFHLCMAMHVHAWLCYSTCTSVPMRAHS